MSKLLIISALVGVVASFLFFIYKEGESKGKVTEIKKQQKIEIEIQNEVIKEKKEIVKRKQISKSKATVYIKNGNIDWSNTDSNLGWLRKNRCKDCKSR